MLEYPQDVKPHEMLSNREYEVMMMLVSGRKVGQIAEDLYLSPKTVSTYRSRILKKLNLKDNEELNSYISRVKLLNDKVESKN